MKFYYTFQTVLAFLLLSAMIVSGTALVAAQAAGDGPRDPAELEASMGK